MKNYFFFWKHLHATLNKKTVYKQLPLNPKTVYEQLPLDIKTEYKQLPLDIKTALAQQRISQLKKARKTNIQQGIEKLKQAHVFVISDSIKKTLMLTNVDAEEPQKVKLPFDVIFLDVSFKFDEIKRFCTKIEKKELSYFGGDEFSGLLIFKTIENNEVVINFLMVIETKEEFGITIFDTRSRKATKSFFYSFLMNFLNFINDPRVSYSEKFPDHIRNEKRIKQNKTPIPIVNRINISGELKKYFAHFSEIMDTKHYTHKFWVRGHWRLMSAERYGKNIGKRFWVAPFVKGEGILVNKKYNVS